MYIGIDLGTSNSSIAGVHEGAVQTFRPADGGEVLPSVIYIDKRGHRLYGRRAYDQAMVSPENVAAAFKRLMGTATPIEIPGAGLALSPEECSAEIIRQLLGQATTETGIEAFDGAVISIPAAFNQMQSEATLRAAKLAGLEHVDLIQEPVAAAMAAMADAKRSGKFLVYDFGGGTFDVALLEATDGEVRIVAQQGVNMLGGRDFDRIIVHEVVRPWLLANFDLPENFLRDPAYRRLARIAQLAAEKAKIDLSSAEEASIFASDDEVRLMDQSETELFLDAPITRSQFEELIRQAVQHTVDLIRTILEENNVATADVDRIVFIGGPTRIPLIRNLVTESLDIVADLKTDPMTAVAEGAAIFCESRQWNAAPAAEAKDESEAKPTQAHTEIQVVSPPAPEPAPEEEPAATETKPQPLELSFTYPARTPNEKATVTVCLSGDAQGKQIKLHCGEWASELLLLVDQMSFDVPLPSVGEKKVTAHLFDPEGNELEEPSQTLTIARVVAAPQSLPAAQTIAVKVRKSVEAEENSFITLVKKGDPLPASGQVQLKSGTTLKSGSPGFIGFEVFQVEYPERVELNLCVGLFRVNGSDLPKGHVIRVGEPMVFDWRMSQGGILQASVQLPASKISLETPRFYAPQAGQISYQGEQGHKLTTAILDRAEEEWGDLIAAVGPDAGPEIMLLKTRLDEQREIVADDPDDAETARLASEEARFIRQDTVRLGRKFAPALLQRQLGKLSALFNRVARSQANDEEKKAFDDFSGKVQKIIDSNAPEALPAADLCLGEMRHIFFAIAWRTPAYVKAWFERLTGESWLFADQEAYAAALAEGRTLQKADDTDALRELVLQMLSSRVSLGASDSVSELATVIKG